MLLDQGPPCAFLKYLTRACREVSEIETSQLPILIFEELNRVSYVVERLLCVPLSSLPILCIRLLPG